MNNLALIEFAGKITAKRRISSGDVQRFQRDLLPDGIATREEAEVLIGLDRMVSKADPAWTGFLVTAMVDFVVWSERPTGIVDEDTARWLAKALAGNADQPASRTAHRIVREIAQEALVFKNDALSTLALVGYSATPRDRAGSARCRADAARSLTTLHEEVSSGRTASAAIRLPAPDRLNAR